MNIDDLTIKNVKDIFSFFNKKEESKTSIGINCFIGVKCIIRTYSSGVWFGIVEEKNGDEVILKDARRLRYWKAVKETSLSAVASYGLTKESNLTNPVTVWLRPIEIIPCTDIAIQTLEGIENEQAR